MPETFRNQLLVPKANMRFVFETRDGDRYEIYVISADHITVRYQYMHNDDALEIPLAQWQKQLSDCESIANITRLDH